MLHQNLIRRITQIQTHIINRDIEWFESNGIDVQEKSGFFILNYSIISDKNEFNKLARALIFQSDGKLVSFPFTRFFNVGEQHADIIDLSYAYLLEKLDGSLLCATYLPNGKLFFHTRRLISEHKPDYDASMTNFDGREIKLLQECESYLKQLKLSFSKHRELTLMFEAILSEQHVVTRYDKSQIGLYLIGVRDNVSYLEWSEEAIDELAKEIGAKRPRIFDTKEMNNIEAYLEQFPNDFEGFVLREELSSNRVKIKKASYLKRHRLLGKLNYKNIIPLALAGEKDEVIAYFPASKEKFDEIEVRLSNLMQRVASAYESLKNEQSRKDYAIRVNSEFPKDATLLFALLGRDENVSVDSHLNKTFECLHNKKQLALLELNDDEGEVYE